MPSPSRLLVCPKCTCHAKLDALQCPCCGFRVRSAEGWITPAAAVVAMGLAVVTCGDETGGGSTSGAGVGGGGGGGVTMSHGVPENAAGYTQAVSTSHSSTTIGSGGAGGDAGGGGAAGNGGEAGAGGSGGAGGK